MKTGIKHWLKQNALFAFYCGIGTLADWGILNLLSMKMDNENVANLISYTIGVMISFFLCRAFVFKVKNHITRRIFSTISVHILGLVLQYLLLKLLLELGWKLNPAKLITIIENAFVMYFLNKYIVFREYKTEQKKVSENWYFSGLFCGYFSSFI